MPAAIKDQILIPENLEVEGWVIKPPPVWVKIGLLEIKLEIFIAAMS